MIKMVKSQFHYGSITTNTRLKMAMKFEGDSIPLWFDYNSLAQYVYYKHVRESQFHYGSITTMIFDALFG